MLCLFRANSFVFFFFVFFSPSEKNIAYNCMLGLFSRTDRPEAKCMQMSTTVKSISLSAQVSFIDGVELERERESFLSWHCSPTFKSQNSRKLSANILWCEFTHWHFQVALDSIPWLSMWHGSQTVHALLLSAKNWHDHVKPSCDHHVCKYALVRRFPKPEP